MFDSEKLAVLATEYSLPVSEGMKIGIVGHAVAAPLIQELYKHILLRGGHPITKVEVEGLSETLFSVGSDKQITFVSPFDLFFMENVDGIISIAAETNVKKLSGVPPEKIKERMASQREIIDLYMRHVKPGGLAIIPYPTQAFAQEAEMSLFEYQDFVSRACFLDKDDPVVEWKKLSEGQERITKELDKISKLRFVGEDTDLRLDVGGRKWINSDGHVNMPSGEVFTGPVENSAEGVIRFTFPGIYMGREIEDITLTFEKGVVTSARALKGEDFLKEILKTDHGAKRIGEIAVGMNKGITRFTKSILFDEKMGFCIHLALGRGFPETGCKNQSSIHWDLLKDMSRGEIYGDGELIYKDGEFTI
ncbi:MAG: aminopeptidase [Candidatus Hydrothermarchaeales archaeon]